MRPEERLNALRQLKRVRAIEAKLVLALKADTPTPTLSKAKTSRKEPVPLAEKEDKAFMDGVINNRVAIKDDDPVYFTSNQTAKMI